MKRLTYDFRESSWSKIKNKVRKVIRGQKKVKKVKVRYFLKERKLYNQIKVLISAS